MQIAIELNSGTKRDMPMKFTPQSSDEELIQGCQNKDRLAQKYLYQRYYGKLLGVCMRYTSNRDEATSILNMAFFKIFDSIHKYRSSGSFKGWISRIALNTSIDHLRSNTTYKKVMDYNSEEEGVIQNDAVEQLAAGELYEVIQKLPAASRSVFCLHAIEGYKHHEIAERLNITVGTSKWHLSSARKQLQVLLKNLDYSRLRS